ncbi:hypothetical protein BUALT_Bualt04G0069000 [Buddleja alternifolia]|uniref:Uncharacterized protein n=1 Tax=Buddleja alternifolia TaxID=168488 RepID=A0AAV6XNX1_9LAMI|nr:hypothetical protein BUALT_Bualt04G0069000 [Buddleja alternifolia]
MSFQKSHANEETSSGGNIRMTEPIVKRKRGDSTNCHQCHRKDREKLVRCTKCQKNYCISCITKWYPRMEEASLAEACPECLNICNCAACLQSDGAKKDMPIPDLKLSTEDKIQYSRYIVRVLVPFLKKFVVEQSMEREEEAKIQGLSVTGLKLAKANPKDQVHCKNCKTSILDIHRSCVNCLYKLCVTCCREIRDIFLRGNGQNHMQDVGTRNVTTNVGSSMVYSFCMDDAKRKTEWKLTEKGTIICPPEIMGGCGCGDLVLNSTYPDNWLSQLLRKAEAVTEVNKNADPLEVSEKACSCSRSDKESSDNHLDCPRVLDVGKPGLRHFQWHLKEGEPVIVPDVLSGMSGLSWEPLVLWRICRKSRTAVRDQEFSVRNCLNWCEEKIEMLQFFKGYTEGLFDIEGRPQILRLEDWPPSESFQERLPRHSTEFFRCLPFKHYTHPQAEMSLKIPEVSLKPDLGPKLYIGYGVPEELGVTRLQYALSDRVNVLMHTAEVCLDPERLSKIEKSRRTHVAPDPVDSLINERTNEEAKKNRQMFEDQKSGVVWDVFRRQDVHKMEEYLRKHSGEFRDISSQQVAPIQEKAFYLTVEHKRNLKQEYGIEPWTFVQRLGDAVFIPAGCIHQSRNLKSCTSVAANFVSPESVGECVRLSAKCRFKEDELEMKKMTLNAISQAVEYLDSITCNTTSTSTSTAPPVAPMAGGDQGGASPPNLQYMRQDTERMLWMLEHRGHLWQPAMRAYLQQEMRLLLDNIIRKIEGSSSSSS